MKNTRVRGRRVGRVLVAGFLAWTLSAQPCAAHDPELPDDFEAVALPGSFNLLVDMAFASDASLFIAQKHGIVWRYDSAESFQATPVLDIQDEVNNKSDRGLLSIALHPDFVPDGGRASWIYLLYTVSPVPGQDMGFDQDDKYSFTRLTRYRAVLSGGVVTADPASREVLLGNQTAEGDVPDTIVSVHNSHGPGTLAFAEDGSLIVSTGDGAHFDLIDTGGFDLPAFDDWIHPVSGLTGPNPKGQDRGAFRSRDPRSLSGKLLRIDPETGAGYPSNPFYTGDPLDNASRVWALGLRNPFRITLFPGTGATDPALGQPGVAAIGDVGQGDWEELDLAVSGGENFDWPCREGAEDGHPIFLAYNPGNPDKVTCSTPLTGVATDPAVAWHHADPAGVFPAGIHVDENGAPLGGFFGGCAVGGCVYAGGDYPDEYDGRLFIADWVSGWIKTVEFDAQWNVVAVRDFATEAEVVDIERHPISGDFYWLNWEEKRVEHVRYTAINATPVAVASASPPIGPAPLTVNFTGGASFDPDGDPIDYDWDFGDASPHSSDADPSHTYTSEGVYTATLAVTDDGGLTGFAQTPVFVGDAPVGVSILSPTPGQTYDDLETISLDGLALDPGGGRIDYEWTADFHHDTHSHPGEFTATGAQASFPLDTGVGGEGDVFYYRIELKATNESGLSSTAHVFIYPDQHVTDVSGTSPFITRVDELVPPVPQGTGEPDPEVMRDAKRPAAGSSDPLGQWDSSHGGDQGSDDWIGMELPSPPAPEVRFVALEFQEGMHFADGGWWEDLSVEVRDGGVWTPAANLHIDPPYPFALAGDPFFDGTSYQTYTLHFDPTHGDAVRLRGTPGGSTGFVSAGELRARLIQVTPPADNYADITAQGMIVAKLFSLSPPLPQGGGNPDPETIRNGTWPPAGSDSALAQFDTSHGGDQGSLDWVGYDFGDTRTLARVDFQEGLHALDGGGFDAIALEAQAEPGGPWVSVPGLVATPPYPAGLVAPGYETYSFSFDPLLARAIRLSGTPAGTSGYISVGELAAYEPAPAEGCGWAPYGEGLGGANSLQLSSPTPAALGLPVLVRVAGALPSSLGFLGVSFGAASLPLKGGTLLLDPGPMHLIPLAYATDGTFSVATSLPAAPGLAGAEIWLQAMAYGQPDPLPVRFSNGLKLIFCTW